MTEVYIMLFITSLLRRMRGKYQPFFNITEIVAKLLVQIKCSRQAMCFIQVIQFRIKT